jgi:Protein of unknown function (DUF3467)
VLSIGLFKLHRKPKITEVTIENRQEYPPEAHNLEGRYANYFKVGYNAFEFLLDFGQYYNEGENAQLHTRIITSPIYVKSLLEFLGNCIDQYEQQFGKITGNSELNNQDSK